MNYTEIAELRSFYFEDSWVLDISARPAILTIHLDVVLLPEHPDYQAPLRGESHCYRRGELRFEKVSTLNWIGQGLPPARDASGETDYGNIDSFDSRNNVYLLKGNFGEIEVRADSVYLKLCPAQG
ncbi:hypothetical protein BU204_35595 [Actinophytocola xanthii]|uniref:Uncharacterized protein n=1 Tax=Actinophytocola xanthii TaxID=1912961 RepID=A0A1Q8BZ97_9PSEU|nr:hypothetical protein BU204_35595 [Actinophytocola xanthii]